VLLMLFKWSFHFQERKKKNKFVTMINQNQSYVDPFIDVIYRDFKDATGYQDGNQIVKFRLAKFPFVFNWIGALDEKRDDGLFSDFVGYAIGMNDDKKIEIYLNYNYWTKLTPNEKRKVMYHELLHDCYNLEHVDDSCDIMSHRINDCDDSDIDSKLRHKITNK
jgi:hypothetical protein